ncbi:MAG: HlyC/CorC family transporter [Clostridiales bacterium]|nr:HlyC/CorC family transporter [Clostridiales bacterium]
MSIILDIAAFTAPVNIVRLVSLILLIVISSFFSSAETAYSMANRMRLKSLAEDGDKKAALVCKILDHYPKMLSTVLIGNNIVNIGASAIATLWATDVLGNWAVGIMTGVLTFVVLIFGEIVPKTSVSVNADKFAKAYAPVINILMIILTPVVIVINFIAGGILKLMKTDPDAKMPAITQRDLLGYVDESRKEGVIDGSEHEIIRNTFDFSDAVAKDIMVPRLNMVALPVDAAYDDVMKIVKNNMYTRIPVYEGDTDTIIGVMNVKDLLFLDDPESFNMKSLIREVMYTHEYKKTSQLLKEMLIASAPIAIVLNEYGTTEGMITMEDLMEELVGEINDEYDSPKDTPIRKLGEGDYLIDGSCSLADVNDELGTELTSEDFDSIGGIVIDHTAGRLPKVGDAVETADGVRIRVARIQGNRIAWVRVFLPPEEETPEEGDAEEPKADTEG